MAPDREFNNIEAIATHPVALDREASDFELREPRELGRLQPALDLAGDLHFIIQTSLFARSREEPRVLDDHDSFASAHPQNLAIEIEERPTADRGRRQFAWTLRDGRLECFDAGQLVNWNGYDGLQFEPRYSPFESWMILPRFHRR